MYELINLSANQFIRKKPGTILLVGLIIAFTELIMLFAVASRENVLIIPDGVGLLNNYGLFSSLIGDAFLVYLVKKYSDAVLEMSETRFIENNNLLAEEMDNFRSMLCLNSKQRRVFFLFIFVGVSSWVSNTTFHLLGLAESHWGGEVFDSPNNKFTFIANRISNFYSWVIILPASAYIVFISSLQLRKMAKLITNSPSANYDLLNADRFGGFGFVEKSHLYFNFSIAIIYLQIIAYTYTFEEMNLEHFLSYGVVTIFFWFGNSLFMSNIYNDIRNLKTDALNKLKEKIYQNDMISLEIFKYYNNSFVKKPYFSNTTALINITKTVVSLIPIFVKLSEKII